MPLQVFTREMGIACAKRLMAKNLEEPSLRSSNRWEFNPICYEIMVWFHFPNVGVHPFVSHSTTCKDKFIITM